VGGHPFYFGDCVSVGVGDLGRAVAWYQEKLGLRLTPVTSEDFDAFLGFSKDDEIGIALVTIPDLSQIVSQERKNGSIPIGLLANCNGILGMLSGLQHSGPSASHCALEWLSLMHTAISILPKRL